MVNECWCCWSGSHLLQNSNSKDDIKRTVSIVLPVDFEGEFMYRILKANVGVFCCLRHDMDMHSQRGCLFSYAQKDGPGGSWSREGIFCVGTPPLPPILRGCLGTSRFCDLPFSTWTGFLLQGHRFVCMCGGVFLYCWTRISNILLHMLVALIAPLHVHVYCTYIVLHTLLISFARCSVNFVGN